MARWAAEYAVAMEIEQPVLNLVLDRYIAALSAHLGYSGRLGRFGSFSVQVTDLNITDLEDIPPVGGGVSTDLQVEADFSLRLLGLIRINTTAVLSVDDVLIDLSKTAAGVPRSVVLSVTPTLTVRVTFRSGGLTGWFLNSFVAPLINVGVWLGFRVIRQVEIDVWKLVRLLQRHRTQLCTELAVADGAAGCATDVPPSCLGFQPDESSRGQPESAGTLCADEYEPWRGRARACADCGCPPGLREGVATDALPGWKVARLHQLPRRGFRTGEGGGLGHSPGQTAPVLVPRQGADHFFGGIATEGGGFTHTQSAHRVRL